MIGISILVAFIFTMLPMPEVAMWCRPAWILLVLLYWQIASGHVGIGFAWSMGLMLDILSGTILGEHALALTIVIYCASKMVLRFRMYPLLQQSLWVFVLVGLYQLIIYCVQGFIHELPHHYLYWFASLVSALLWPWLSIFMRDCRYWLRVT
jgi:rod shape-determining protein MreD